MGKRKPRRIYTKEERLIITGRRKRDAEYIVINVPGVVKDSLKLYGIIHKVSGGAGEAIKFLISKHPEMQTIIKYMREQQTSAKRMEILDAAVTREGE